MKRIYQALLAWPRSRWLVSLLFSITIFMFLALATALIENPIFGRSIAPTAWAVPVAVLTSVLSGLLLATYFVAPQREESPFEMKSLGIGSVLAFFAVGCPVCNKLVLIALGTSGAIQWFAPVQPYLAAIAIVLLVWALVKRVENEFSCQLDSGKVTHGNNRIN